MDRPRSHNPYPERLPRTQTDEFQEERAKIRREYDKDELWIEGEQDPFPPTHYDR